LSKDFVAPTHEEVRLTFENVIEKPLEAVMVLDQLSALLPSELWSYISILMENLTPKLVEPK
jgi:hypothetical protein